MRYEIDGLLVSPGEVAALKSTLDRLMGDAGLRVQFADRAVEARERFSVQRIVGISEKLLAEVLSDNACNRSL